MEREAASAFRVPKPRAGQSFKVISPGGTPFEEGDLLTIEADGDSIEEEVFYVPHEELVCWSVGIDGGCRVVPKKSEASRLHVVLTHPQSGTQAQVTCMQDILRESWSLLTDIARYNDPLYTCTSEEGLTFSIDDQEAR